MDKFDCLANAYYDCKVLTDFTFNSLANNFCNCEELKDFCNEKILQVISFSCEDFEQGQPAKLAEAIPCSDNRKQFSEVVEKEPNPWFRKLITEEQLNKGIKHRIPSHRKTKQSTDWG